MNNLPLAGTTVVSIEQAVSAPFASRQLADLGARVIKIERPGGEFARRYDTTVDGQASFFVWLNRGKESLELNLKDAEDATLLHRICAKADVFIQNLAPGAAQRLGFGADDLRADHPELIYVSISGYGVGGPYEQKKAYDLLVQCEAGLLSVTGSPGYPAKVGVSVADIAAGTYAFAGVLTALLARAKTGVGDVLEVSMLEALGEWMQQPYFFSTYGPSPMQPSGPYHPTISPYGPVTTADGTVFLGLQNEREWKTFCDLVLSQPDLSSDERFASNELRAINREELTQIINEHLGTYSSDNVIEMLEKAGIANARMRSMEEFATHPQFAARDRWVDVQTPSGLARSLLPPVTAQSFRAAMGPVPAAGSHNEYIRQEFPPND